MAARSSRTSWLSRGMAASLRPPRLVAREMLALKLLVSRRPGLMLGADALILFMALVSVAVGGSEPREAWGLMVVLPMMLLGVPIVSDVLALERRAGSLDFALASPGAATIFERRLLPAIVLFAAQGSAILTLSWYVSDRAFAIVPALAKVLLLHALLGAAALFWATRLRTPGAVALAMAATLGVLGKWALAPPMPREPVLGAFLPPRPQLLDAAGAAAVVAGACAVLWLHARRRLARPEILFK